MDDVIFVPSDSDPERVYAVRLVTYYDDVEEDMWQRWVCSCPGYEHRGPNPCKHMRGVLSDEQIRLNRDRSL